MKAIHIIGGGLAGLTLGVALRQHDVPVTVSEAAPYPRHRVCGEFISGGGLEVLRRLELEPLLRSRGAVYGEDAAFFLRERALGIQRLPSPALSISRYILDSTLAERLLELGGHIEHQRLPADPAEGVILATGRRPEPRDASGWKWFGLKAHAHGVPLAAHLEMHLDEHAYVGLCRLGHDTVNVCGLFRRKRGDDTPAGVDALRGRTGSALFQRLGGVEFDRDSICAVAGLGLRPMPPDPENCRIGDAWTMIPPITGNGMSMAFESADLATPPLVEYARGAQDWPSTTAAINAALTVAFRPRLRWAARLHGVLFHRLTRDWLLPAAFPIAMRKAFLLTRS